jgi:hypothetical protein
MNMHQESATPALPKVYIETSVISYMTARPSAEPITLARQLSSVMLWQLQHQFEFFVSDAVIDEISVGDPSAAQVRLASVTGLPRLEETPASQALAQALMLSKAVPETSELDALHIALAAVHQMDFIASWNFKHIAGASARQRVSKALRELGYAHLAIFTPEDLIEGALP